MGYPIGYGGGLNEEKHGKESCTESGSYDGEVRDVRCNWGEDEPASPGLFKAYRCYDSLHEMPCKGAHETASYCNMCSMRERILSEGSQVQSEDLWEPGVPCPVWEDLRTQTVEHFWDAGEPDIPRLIDKCKDRVERIKCLGNAVVPQQFYPFFMAIMEAEKGERNGNVCDTD